MPEQSTDSSDLSENGDVSVPEVPPPVVSFDVTCRTADDKLVVVPSHILSCSKVFSQMCGDLDIVTKEDDQDKTPSFPGEFFVANMQHELFLKVIEWCKEHAGLPDPVIEEHHITKERVHFVFTDFEKEFLDVSVPELKELLMASNYLDIPSLYLYSCQRAAELMTNKTVEQVRQEWGFVDDIPEAEKERIRKEHAWCLL
uniref:Skp1-related protein n=1 Tax=Ditylenchus dipsaci TaxID=166011 RepID=A0A915DVB8_9BILA